jgi:predicted deacylase
MITETAALIPASPGTTRQLTRHVWGKGNPGPRVHVQAALHADEMPGAIVAWHLMGLLDRAEAEGRIMGEIGVVPLANPIGLGQWVQNKPQGRQDLDSMRNFNRGYPDLAALVGNDLDGRLTDDPAQNLTLIRQAFLTALDRAPAQGEVEDMRLRLMRWSAVADHVLDLHCDHVALLHFYASGLRPADTDLFGRATGAALALVQDVSGGNAFDEAHTAPWRDLALRYGDRHPIPPGCFSTTVEYRGQADVADATAATDAARLMAFLGAIGAVRGEPAPAHPPAPEYPLGGAAEAFAPQGGIVTWVHAPGAMVTAGEPVAHVSDPVTRRRLPVPAPTTGLLFRREMWPSCLAGQSLCHVAGHDILRQGHLLSD